MKKIVVPGLAAGLAMLVVMMVISFASGSLFPSVQAEYQNTNLFRPWSDPLMSLMFMQPFILGLVLAWIWNRVKGIVKGVTPGKKAINFALVYWVVAIPGMVMSWSTFQISLAMVITWWISILAQAFAGAWVLAKMNK